ncbi:phosphotransacetylase family protein [Lyngbya confervoides]|uniref:Phosphotransacetylase family protein n=1 Tax=Lyngbya confervoides BDU141951 TaxID=1574623 RepID=A0ABD4T2L2_9CYAN|nr:phosphotransacetylase family protein [Lyngbya confervoides]MCM1982680.1 phosphotransacetylase family protein [Lyngbya confervoides BDU141951]
MPDAAKSLLIGAVEAFSGKSTVLLGLAQLLKQQGLNLVVGKPVVTSTGSGDHQESDEDIRLLQHCLELSPEAAYSPIVSLDDASISARVLQQDKIDYVQGLKARYQLPQSADIGLFEGPATFDEGRLFGMSLYQIAEAIKTPVLLVVRFHALEVVDTILSARSRLGPRLLGVVINDVPLAQADLVQQTMAPFLESQGIPVLGVLPHRDLLRSVSVAELVRALKAEVICCPNRLNLMVGQLSIGAMNANSALKYFRKGNNMAVVTGGARTDIQLAALEAATHCLILTGHVLPNEIMIGRAENLEVPVLSVSLDTLSTVDIIENSFRHARFYETVKVDCIRTTVQDGVNLPRLVDLLNQSAQESRG